MELKEQKFGIEIEMTGITRAKAAEVTAEYFGTRVKYLGTYYDTYAAIDTEGRQWKFMSDGSITAQKKSNGRKINAGREYQTEMVSPICRYEDIVTIQEIIRKLKEHGALTNGSCGIHVHINAEPFDARTLRNITNIMAAKEDLIYKALGVSVDRQHRWCQPVDTRFLEELNRRKPKSMEAVERIWYNGESRRDQHYDDSRYHCLNLHSVFQKGTVEFRLFNGTLHAGKIKAYIQFCLAIGAQALNQSCASRRKTQTSNEKYMKYDKMIAVNKAESEQKIKKAIRAIDDMGARGLPISVTELVRWTGLSRGFFYKNVQVRQKLEEAIKQPRRIDVQQPSEERNAADYNFQELKKDFNSCQSENQRLKAENEQLLQKCSILQKEVDTLKKRLDRKEIALLKKL